LLSFLEGDADFVKAISHNPAFSGTPDFAIVKEGVGMAQFARYIGGYYSDVTVADAVNTAHKSRSTIRAT